MTQAIDEKAARELEEKFDPEMRFRPVADLAGAGVAAALFALSAFHYWTAGIGLLEETLHRGVQIGRAHV